MFKTCPPDSGNKISQDMDGKIDLSASTTKKSTTGAYNKTQY